jgi:hypothetical protein
MATSDFKVLLFSIQCYQPQQLWVVHTWKPAVLAHEIPIFWGGGGTPAAAVPPAPSPLRPRSCQPLLEGDSYIRRASMLPLYLSTGSSWHTNGVGRLVVVMGRDFVSVLRPVACCTIPGWKRMWPSERNRLGLTPNLTTRGLCSSRRWAMKWEFCLFVPVGLQKFFYMP